jgi:hypothetical protein
MKNKKEEIHVYEQMINNLIGSRFSTKELIDTLKTISMSYSGSLDNSIEKDCNERNIFNDYCIYVTIKKSDNESLNYKIFYLNTNQKDKILITDTELL